MKLTAYFKENFSSKWCQSAVDMSALLLGDKFPLSKDGPIFDGLF